MLIAVINKSDFSVIRIYADHLPDQPVSGEVHLEVPQNLMDRAAQASDLKGKFENGTWSLVLSHEVNLKMVNVICKVDGGYEIVSVPEGGGRSNMIGRAPDGYGPGDEKYLTITENPLQIILNKPSTLPVLSPVISPSLWSRIKSWFGG